MARKIANPIGVTVTDFDSSVKYVSDWRSKTRGTDTPNFNDEGFTSAERVFRLNTQALTRLMIGAGAVLASRIAKGDTAAVNARTVITDFLETYPDQVEDDAPQQAAAAVASLGLNATQLLAAAAQLQALAAASNSPAESSGGEGEQPQNA